ncbi:AMP-binding protein [Pseudomonas juntendi]|nr:AMP-binding protein [Pseudomonas sp. DCB_BI]
MHLTRTAPAIGLQQHGDAQAATLLGGAKLHRELAHKAIANASIRLQQVFGMAEGLVCYTCTNDPTEVVASIQGTPMSELDEVELRGQTDTAGELCARGPCMIPGYFNDPHADRQAFDQRGFCRSGNLVRHAHGDYLEVIGRSVETLNRNGEKIDPHEVENVIMKHPAVIDAVLVGLTAADGTLRLVLFAIATQPLTLVQARAYLVLTSRSALDVERLISTDHLMAHGLTSMEMLQLVDYFNDQDFLISAMPTFTVNALSAIGWFCWQGELRRMEPVSQVANDSTGDGPAAGVVLLGTPRLTTFEQMVQPLVRSPLASRALVGGAHPLLKVELRRDLLVSQPLQQQQGRMSVDIEPDGRMVLTYGRQIN